VFQIIGWAKTQKALEPKLWLWRRTDNKKVAEERIVSNSIWETDERTKRCLRPSVCVLHGVWHIDLVGLRCCQRSDRSVGKLVCIASCVEVVILNRIRQSSGSKWRDRCFSILGWFLTANPQEVLRLDLPLVSTKRLV